MALKDKSVFACVNDGNDTDLNSRVWLFEKEYLCAFNKNIVVLLRALRCVFQYISLTDAVQLTVHNCE